MIVDASALLAVVLDEPDVRRAPACRPRPGSRRFERDIRRSRPYFYQYRQDFYQGRHMGAQLNIKSDDAYRLASRLSELTGESLTSVVTKALQAELDRQERARDREERLRRVREITADIRQHLRQPLPSSNHDWLYDENGLPR